MTIDQEIGDIVDTIDLSNTTVIVFSLEGMRRSSTQLHFMPDLLEVVNHTYLLRKTGKQVNRRKQRSSMKFLREKLPSEWQGRIGRHTPVWVRDWVVGRQFDSGLVWTDTPGFALPCGGESFIRLNIKGREREGMLDSAAGDVDEYSSLVEECLRSFRHAETGVYVVKDVLYGKENFPGEKNHLLPDIIITWQDESPAQEIVSDRYGTLKARYLTGRQGLHCSRGFAAAIGKRARPGIFNKIAHIADLGALTKALLAPYPEA